MFQQSYKVIKKERIYILSFFTHKTMQNPTDKTSRMLLKTEEELFNTVITVIDETHPFRKLNQLIDFEAIISPLRDLYSDWGQKGIDVSKGFKALYFILYLFKNFVRGFDTPASRPYAS